MVGQGKQISYQDNNHNLKEDKSLIVFDWTLTIISLQYSVI